MTKVFVSYSRKDKAVAKQLTEALQRSELETWIDWEDIPAIADWLEQIHKGIEQSDGFLFLLSPDSVKSNICGQEIAHAVQNAKRLIPIVVRDVDPQDVHPALAKVNWIYCREQDDFNKAINKTLSAIRTDLTWVEAQRRLQVRALEWDKSKEGSLLLRGKDLSTAEEQLATSGQRDPQPTDLQRQYVLESRRRESRSRNTALSIGTVVLIMVALLSVFANSQRILAGDNAKTAIANANVAATEKSNAESQKLTAVANANIALARQLAVQASVAGSGYDSDIREFRGLLAVESLRRFPTSAADGALRNLGDFWKIQTSTPSSKQFILDVAITVDGKRASWTDQTGIVIVDISGGKTLRVIPTESPFYRITFSPDGKWMASDKGLLNTISDAWTITRSEQEITAAIAFNSDSTQVAFSDDNGRISIFNTATGDRAAALSHGGSVRALAFRPNGEWVASAGEEGNVEVWDIATSKKVTDLVLKDPVNAVVFSPDGKKLAIAAGAFALNIQVWDTSTWEVISNQAVSKPPTFSLSELLIQFSPDGNWIASQISDGMVLIWQTSNGKEIARLYTENSSALYRIAFSPDGQWIAAADAIGAVHVWEVATQIERVRVYMNGNSFSAIPGLKFSPDGKSIITINDTGMVERWLWKTEDLIESACKNFLTRNFYTWEWTQYFADEPYHVTCPNFPPAPVPTPSSITIMTMEAGIQLISTAEYLSTATP